MNTINTGKIIRCPSVERWLRTSWVVSARQNLVLKEKDGACAVEPVQYTLSIHTVSSSFALLFGIPWSDFEYCFQVRNLFGNGKLYSVTSTRMSIMKCTPWLLGSGSAHAAHLQPPITNAAFWIGWNVLFWITLPLLCAQACTVNDIIEVPLWTIQAFYLDFHGRQ